MVFLEQILPMLLKAFGQFQDFLKIYSVGFCILSWSGKILGFHFLLTSHIVLNKNSPHLPEEDLMTGQVKEIKFFCSQDADAPGIIALFSVGLVISSTSSHAVNPTGTSPQITAFIQLA